MARMANKEAMLSEVDRWVNLGYCYHDVGGSVLDFRDEIRRQPYDQIDRKNELAWRFLALRNDVRAENVLPHFSVVGDPGSFLTDAWLGILASSLKGQTFRGIVGHEIRFHAKVSPAHWITQEYLDEPYDMTAEDLLAFSRLQIEVTQRESIGSAALILYRPLAPCGPGSVFQKYEPYDLPCSE